MQHYLIALLAISLATATDFPTVDRNNFTEKFFDNIIDHFDYQDNKTYKQRYFLNDDYFDEKNGPIFLYICGEYTCSIRDDRLFAFMVGAKHNARLIALEHRYYGISQPFGNLTMENLRYLSTEQALADIAYFLEEMNEDKPDRQVVVVGGSYPGALSAWFREKYPQMAVASWSSSGVVYPIKNFWQFDEQIYTSTLKSGENCPKTIQYIFDKVNNSLADNSTKENVMSLMGASPDMHTGDFAFFFADIFVESVQYGNRTGLCNLISQIQGKDFDDQLKAIKVHAAISNVAPQDYCRNSIKNTTITDSSARSWTYQYCMEFGWFQVPGENHPMRPESLLGLDYWNDMCSFLFHADTDKGIKRSISQLAGQHISGSNTIFINGIEDPWQWATERNPIKKLNQKSIMADCEDCGHCADLYTPKNSDSSNLQQVRRDIVEFISDVLKPYDLNDEETKFMQ